MTWDSVFQTAQGAAAKAVGGSIDKIGGSISNVKGIGSDIIRGNLFGTQTAGGAGSEASDSACRPINEFISTIKQVGLAKHNNFTFTFAPPIKTETTYGGGGVDTRMLNLFCASCQLPGLNIATTPIRTIGEQFEMPNDKIYDPIQTTFYVDTAMHVKKVFDDWASLIQDPITREFSFLNQYAKQVIIHIYDNRGRPHMEVELEDAYPKTIGSIQLSHDNREFMRLDVTWVYRRWVSRLIPQDIHSNNGQVGTQRTPNIHDRLVSFIGDFKGYQDQFNNLAGNSRRTKDMLQRGDWGGLAGANFNTIGNLF